MGIRQLSLILVIGFFADFFIVCASASADILEFPPYRGLNLKFSGSVSENYSTNITFASDKENRIEDFFTMLTLGFDLQYEGKTRTLGLSGRVRRQIHTRTLGVQNSSESITIDFHNELSDYDDIILSNTFTHTQIPRTFEEEFGRITGRFNSYRNRFNLNYNRDISKHFKISANYTNALNWNEAKESRDSYQNNGGFEVNYLPSIITNFSVGYAFVNSKFKDGGDISTHSITAGIRRNITKRLSFIGRAGMSFTPFATNNIIGASLTNEISKKILAELSYSRGVQVRTDTEDIFRNRQITALLKTDLLKDLNGSISGFYGQGKFVSTGVTDRLVGARVSFDYSFWKGKKGTIRGKLGYGYSNLDSTSEDRGYTRSTVNIGLTVEF